jgi:hypothetical protein
MYEATDSTGHRLLDITDIASALGHSARSARSLAVTQESYIGPLNDHGRKTAGQLVD